MTIKQLQRDVRRLQQRARRATTRLNKLRLKLALEGKDCTPSVSILSWEGMQHWNLTYKADCQAQNLLKVKTQLKSHRQHNNA